MNQVDKPKTATKSAPSTYSTRPQSFVDFDKLKSKAPSSVPKPSKKIGYIFGIVILLLFVSFGGGWLGAKTYNNSSAAVTTSKAAKQQYISNESDLIQTIAKDVGQSVVSVDVEGQDTTNATDFFGFVQPQTQTTQSAGTGFIISPSGIIVTNRHVVPSGTTKVSVTLSDGTKYDNVEVMGRTSDSSSQDIAFLRITDLKGKTLVPVTLGDSSEVQIGDKVIAIGNALGQFQNTVTSGIISGYGRDVTAGDQSSLQSSEALTDLIQTDAAINEGNSGGPLVNINGEVIGINTAVASGAQNIGFAQPVNDLKGLISGVLDKGEIQQPYLGVRYVSLTNDLAKEFNIKVTRGAYITSAGGGQVAVVEGSPAARAGLQDKDVITKVDNTDINDKNSLTSVLSKHKVGDQVNLTVVRDGKTIHVKVSLGNLPSS
ncbi:trypsin-like peptidase domain-containing protein [Candidatus Saccharibacteria bacterium]|nr:trypsin-like peptidase domain-containing protein [Candidatus Saccharibacteria bacterium]